MHQSSVSVWEEKVVIPTYGVGKPNKNPMFFENRIYQGSSGVVYPHPVIEKIEDEKKDQEYTAVFLENEYLKIMILPELGGRIQRAYDKIRKRDFVYYNQVIKPALVGLAGPWISGGIEFNWPQHHRPSTFSPVDYEMKENADGSKTVWVNETEIMFRTKGMAGFTLYPGKAYLEISGKLFNPTPFPQTFLWWANPAVKVNEYYQSVFPPDVYAVFDHGKRDVSDFPVATGTYYKVDYAPGTDISRYANIPVPTSYMAIQSKYGFMGCYEHDTQAGMLHVADHHLSPGKKQWTWGNGDFGFAWDRNLTDEDGPYIELMTGVFTDNQPDFSWLQPNEGKTFEQYFMPYAQVGVVKNAAKEAMIGMELDGNTIIVKVYATAVYKNATVTILYQHHKLKSFKVDFTPDAAFETSFEPTEIINENGLEIIVENSEGQNLVTYQPDNNDNKEIPTAATAAKLPADIAEIEDLYLNGIHLEQYRHASYHPMDYYEEALRRSPEDIRCNNAIGLLLLRRGQFKNAEPYFRIAIKSMIKRNPNPYDGEPYFNLGQSLKLQGRKEEAYDAFYKATWNDALQHSAFLELSRIATAQNKITLALSLIEKSLIRNYHSPTVRHLNTSLLRLSGRQNEALALIEASLKIDPFNYGCLFEQYLISVKLNDDVIVNEQLTKLMQLMRNEVNNYLELSLSYAQAGLYHEAIAVLDRFEAFHNTESPLPYYYRGWFSIQLGNQKTAEGFYRKAANQRPDLCFPNKIEEVLILQSAILVNPEDAKAAYYLGNFWYDKRQYAEAIVYWEQSVLLGKTFPTVLRNLGIAYFNKENNREKALSHFEKAFSYNATDARVLMELDQLYKRLNRRPENRLKFLNNHLSIVTQRDDVYLERVSLYNFLGEHETALRLVEQRQFHPWEGGEGKVSGQYVSSLVQLAHKCLEQGLYEKAIDYLNTAQTYPQNLGEGKLYGTQENDIFYWLGCAHEGSGQSDLAETYFAKATIGLDEPSAAIFYNDQQPDKIFYQGLAHRKLGNNEQAHIIFSKLIEYGHQHINDDVRIDYFAVSLPDLLIFDDDLNLRNRVHTCFMQGLGYLGLEEFERSADFFNIALALDAYHSGSKIHLAMSKQSLDQLNS